MITVKPIEDNIRKEQLLSHYGCSAADSTILVMEDGVYELGYVVIDVIPVSYTHLDVYKRQPLDGSKILASFLPQRLMEQFYRYQGVFVIILYVLMFTGALSGPLSYIQTACANGILWLAKLPFHLAGAL